MRLPGYKGELYEVDHASFACEIEEHSGQQSVCALSFQTSSSQASYE